MERPLQTVRALITANPGDCRDQDLTLVRVGRRGKLAVERMTSLAPSTAALSRPMRLMKWFSGYSGRRAAPPFEHQDQSRPRRSSTIMMIRMTPMTPMPP